MACSELTLRRAGPRTSLEWACDEEPQALTVAARLSTTSSRPVRATVWIHDKTLPIPRTALPGGALRSL